MKVHLRGYLEKCLEQSPEKIKKFLSANQAMLALADRGAYIETGKMFISGKGYQNHTDKLFRAYGFIHNRGKDCLEKVCVQNAVKSFLCAKKCVEKNQESPTEYQVLKTLISMGDF